MPAHNSSSLLTNSADIDLLLEPTRQMLRTRGYTIPRNYLTQVCTEVCSSVPVTRVWTMMIPKGKLPPVVFRIRLYFRSIDQRDHCLAALALSEFDASCDEVNQQDIAAKFALMVCIPLESLLSQTVSPADNATRVAKFVEKVLSHANG